MCHKWHTRIFLKIPIGFLVASAVQKGHKVYIPTGCGMVGRVLQMLSELNVSSEGKDYVLVTVWWNVQFQV